MKPDHPTTRRLRILLAASLLAATNALAAGTVSFVTGTVTVTNSAGDTKPLVQKARVETGDTIATGAGGEVHIVTDDHGLIAMRPDSRLRIDDYAANGDEKDRAALSILKGFTRSVTGWIGKVAPANYRLRVRTATVGIRGTDHEVGLVETEGAGTVVSKVTDGEISLGTAEGRVFVKAGAAAGVDIGRRAAPKLLDQIPPVFKRSPNESLIDSSKARLAAEREDKLRQRREDVRAGGAVDADGRPRLGAACSGGDAPAEELMAFIRAYEAGDLARLQSLMDPGMLGYQRQLDGFIQEFNRLKQIRLHLKDVQVQCGSELSTVNFSWEKRFLDAVTFAPGLLSGRGTALLHRGRDTWRVAGIAGDNPFSGNTGTRAQLTFGPSFSLATITAIPRLVPVTVEVVDADLAGAGSVTVQIVTNQGDAEMVVLQESLPGRFSRNGITVSSAAPAKGNGILEVATGVELFLRYLDQNPGNNLPPTMTTVSLRPTGSILITPDTTPDAFSFAPVSNAVAGSPVISGSTTITGINAPTSITISGGEYSIDNGPFVSAAGTLTNGQRLRLRVTASGTSGGLASATVNVGGVQASFMVTTALAIAAPAVPNPFTFLSIGNATPGQLYGSNPVAITGFTGTAPISIVGGTYSVNGGPFTSAVGQLASGQTVVIQLLASNANLTTTSATLTVGGISGTFSVTTAPTAGISTPAPFSYTARTGTALSLVIDSAPATITGINVPSPVTIVGGLYSINGGAFTASPGSITNGQTLVVRVVSSASFGTTTSATVNVGGVSAVFSVTTLAAVTAPAAFTFTPQANVAPGAVITSNAVTITGINAPSPVSIIGGTYSINGGPFTSAPGTATNNQQVTVRVTSAAAVDGTGLATATLNVGGVTGGFSATTWDTTPNLFAFANLLTTSTAAPPCLAPTSQYTTAPVVITGLTAPATVTLAAAGANPGATMSINGGAFIAGPTTIANNQTIAVRVNTVAALTGTTNVSRAVVTIGGVAATVTQRCQ